MREVLKGTERAAQLGLMAHVPVLWRQRLADHCKTEASLAYSKFRGSCDYRETVLQKTTKKQTKATLQILGPVQ